MPQLSTEIRPVRDGLLKVGFEESRLRFDVPVPGRVDSLPLLAFADSPFDSRTAAVAALRGQSGDEADIAALRPLGAPIVFVCFPDYCQLWKQGPQSPQFQQRFKIGELSRFFELHHDELAPRAIYRAKLWARLEQSFQLEFVDPSFLPLIESDAGHKLTELVERVVGNTKRHLNWHEISDADGRWLLQSVFWLLAAKILQDKAVPGFVRLSLNDVEDVYERVARHYNSESPRPIRVGSREKKEALIAASEEIRAYHHCGALSTEALAYLYESALIDRTVRRKLGTHSTPTWLVDYIVGRLRPLVESEIPVQERRVFEPACGHAGFLIAAMRLLSELLPTNWQQPRRTYLRERLHGLEIDGFALEIARLSLTLADVPNPNGWALTEENMFKADLLERGVRDATIVLGNPPFENFVANERRQDWLPNKAAETFRRVVEHLPPGGVFGFVLPQTFLHAKQAADVRRILLRDYEISEISLFADKVFRYGEPESTVIIGRRLTRGTTRVSRIHYQRVREWQIEEFTKTYEPGSAIDVEPEQFVDRKQFSLVLPDLASVWKELTTLPRFEGIAEIGQGFSHKGQNDKTLPRGAIKESRTHQPGLRRGFAGWNKDQTTHTLPSVAWLNLHPDTILASRWGAVTGAPQVLLNYARVSREAWRLKALIDEQGHPVTSDFLVIRPKQKECSLPVLWALCNSPIANAYLYCHSNKRHVLAGHVRQMPVPDLAKHDLGALREAVSNYLNAAQGLDASGRKKHRDKASHNADQMDLGLTETRTEADAVAEEQLKMLHWRIDAQVLRLYNLPSGMERKVLDLFSGIRRRGVPFEQMEYFPEDFTDLERLSDLLAITTDWPQTNRRRSTLLDLEEKGRLTAAQAVELEQLQRLADARVSLVKPFQTDAIDEKLKELKRQGLWTE